MDPTLKEVGEIAHHLSNSLLSKSKLWDRPISQITPLQFKLFHKRHAMNGHAQQASNELDAALFQIRSAICAGQIKGAPVEHLSAPQTRGQSNVYPLSFYLDKITVGYFIRVAMR